MDERNAIKLLDKTFNTEFDIDRYSAFVKELFNVANIRIQDKTPYIANQYKEYISEFKKISEYKDSSRKRMEILTVKLNRTSSRDRARTMQRNFIANWLGKMDIDAALVAFYGEDPEDWRFSFVKMEYNLIRDEEGKVKIAKELTPAKRYSYLVGVNEPNHTCRRQFIDLVIEEDTNPMIIDIEQVFSIDNVTKEFFEKYKKLVVDLKESLERMVGKDTIVKKEFDEKGITAIDFSKKLLGQIVFIYFLQKKGWLGIRKNKDGTFKEWGAGQKKFLRKLYDGDIIEYDNFFNDILEPLFYEALATEHDKDYYSRFNCKIPFLNGGLFEPINDYDWTETDILLDNSIFKEILDTFDRFNFTVKEDEPLEKEVAVDPEMLGKVFENLLDVKDRKSRGAFYTPREIVHYMCQQSLINYLETNTEIPIGDIEKFIRLGDFALDIMIREQEQIREYSRSYDIDEKRILPKSIKENYQKIERLLKDIKIVDPAVGSGAFPMGMMNEIVKARSVLTVFFDKSKQKNRTNYKFKSETIENSLYGVDIDSSAVDIAKLRFWLSLIVDESDITEIQPLPNLDHKIMCGNSLLEEFEGIKLFDEELLGEIPKDNSFELEQIDQKEQKLNQERHEIYTGKKENKGRSKEIKRELEKLKRKRKAIVAGPKEDIPQLTLDEAVQKRKRESQKKLKELKALQKKFFNEQNRELKRQHRSEIDRIEWELIEETLKEEDNEEAMEQLEQYKKNKSKPFFLWKLYFSDVFQRENPGFDVVIGNPPYVKEYTNKNAFDGLRDLPYYQGKMDLWYLFGCIGIDILRNEGVECYIAPNNWITNAGASIFRNKIIADTQILQFIDFGNYKIFSAGIQTMVYLLKKSKNSSTYDSSYSKLMRENISSLELSDFLHSKQEKQYFKKYPVEFDSLEFKDTYITFLTKDIATVLDHIEREGNFRLNKSEIAQGIVSPQETLTKSNAEKLDGVYEVGIGIFVLDDTEKDNLNFNKNEVKIIKPYYTTNQIAKYRFDSRNKLWIIYTKSDIKNKISDYPNIKRHLDRFGKIITSDNKPYGLHRARNENFFIEEKIISLRKCVEPTFSYTTSNSYVSQTFFIIKPERINAKYLLSILNSRLVSFWLFYKGKLQGNLYQVDFEPLKNIPIKEIPPQKQHPSINIVDQILFITKDDDYPNNPEKQARVKELEKEIDKLVYKLYDLTPEEIDIVENFNKEK